MAENNFIYKSLSYLRLWLLVEIVGLQNDF